MSPYNRHGTARLQGKTPTIILTRPAQQAEAFAADLRGILPGGADVLVSPVLEIHSVSWSPPDRATYAIVTSSHAVSALGGLPISGQTPVYCVGSATAQAVAGAGFRAIVGGGDASELLETIRSERPDGFGVYLRGRHVAADLAAALDDEGLTVRDIVVYEQRARALTPAAQAMLEGTDRVILPLFSPRTARLVSEQVEKPGPGLCIVAMSPAVASAWGRGAAKIDVAERPTAAAMLDAVVALCRPRGAC